MCQNFYELVYNLIYNQIEATTHNVLEGMAWQTIKIYAWAV